MALAFRDLVNGLTVGITGVIIWFIEVISIPPKSPDPPNKYGPVMAWGESMGYARISYY